MLLATTDNDKSLSSDTKAHTQIGLLGKPTWITPPI